MIKGKTDSGFEFEVDENRLDDVRLVDAIAIIEDKSNPVAVARAHYDLRLVLLGEDQNRKLITFVKKKHGDEDYAPAPEVNDIVSEIMTKIGETNSKVKNS